MLKYFRLGIDLGIYKHSNEQKNLCQMKARFYGLNPYFLFYKQKALHNNSSFHNFRLYCIPQMSILEDPSVTQREVLGDAEHYWAKEGQRSSFPYVFIRTVLPNLLQGSQEHKVVTGKGGRQQLPGTDVMSGWIFFWPCYSRADKLQTTQESSSYREV